MRHFRLRYWRRQWIIIWGDVTSTRVAVLYAHTMSTSRRSLGGTCFWPRYFVNKVSGQHFSVENEQEAEESYSQHLPVHSRGVIWKIKSKSTLPVSVGLISAEINLVGNYRTMRGLRTVNPEGFPSTRHLPEMPAEFQTLHSDLAPTNGTDFALTLWGLYCLVSWPWWRHREPRDTKSESKIPSTLLTPLLGCGLLRTLSTVKICSTMNVLPLHVRRAMLRSVNPCISSVIVLPLIPSIWMIFFIIIDTSFYQ